MNATNEVVTTTNVASAGTNAAARGRRRGPAGPRDPVQDQHNATVLFNGMINPVIPYAIRGVIWYQGESIIGGSGAASRFIRMCRRR